MKPLKRLVSMALALALTACATAPSGRSQLLLFSDGQMSQLGTTSFDRMKSEGKLARDTKRETYVRCVVDALVAQLPEPWRATPWEVRVFADSSANAFALPGGKVGVNNGMFSVAQSQDQLAAVLGHEIGHVVFRHSNERASASTLADTGLGAVNAYVATKASASTNTLVMSALGLGAQVGVLLPFSRKHESEADVYGQQLMAKAGFDPGAAVALWQNMASASQGQRAPQWLSTHPDPTQRIARLRQGAPPLMAAYRDANARGLVPDCRP